MEQLLKAHNKLASGKGTITDMVLLTLNYDLFKDYIKKGYVFPVINKKTARSSTRKEK